MVAPILSSTGVAIPLTILQGVSSSLSTGSVFLPDEQILVNCALAIAVYGKDRAKEKEEVSFSRACAVGASIYLGTGGWILPFFLLFLHEFYSDFKKVLGPLKPVFVASMWTLACNEPLSHSGLPPLSFPVLSWIFLLSVFFSHSEDIPDIEEDKLEGVATPASILGKRESILLSSTLALASVCVHVLCGDNYGKVDAIIDASTLLCSVNLLSPSLFLLSSFLLLSLTLFSAYENRLSVLNSLFLATSAPHEMALETTVRITNLSSFLPDEDRKRLLHAIGHALDYFDTLGHEIVHMYSQFLLHT